MNTDRSISDDSAKLARKVLELRNHILLVDFEKDMERLSNDAEFKETVDCCTAKFFKQYRHKLHVEPGSI